MKEILSFPQRLETAQVSLRSFKYMNTLWFFSAAKSEQRNNNCENNECI